MSLCLNESALRRSDVFPRRVQSSRGRPASEKSFDSCSSGVSPSSLRTSDEFGVFFRATSASVRLERRSRLACSSRVRRAPSTPSCDAAERVVSAKKSETRFVCDARSRRLQFTTLALSESRGQVRRSANQFGRESAQEKVDVGNAAPAHRKIRHGSNLEFQV